MKSNALLHSPLQNKSDPSLLEEFNQAIDIWIAELPPYEFDQILIKPDPESWSLGQVYKHLIHETGYYMEQIETCMKNNENSSGEMTEEAKAMFRNNEFPDERITGDVQSAAKVTQPSGITEILNEMQSLIIKMNELWNDILRSRSSGKTRHPGLGYFNAREWFRFAGMHLRHHLRQKRRIDDFLNMQSIES